MAYWSDLPPELLDLVATGFDTPSDTRHFRSVCFTWRSAIPKTLPIFFPPIKFLNSNVHHCDLRLTKHTFTHLSPSFDDHDGPGWLIKTEEHNPGAVHLFNPFSRTLIKQLAPNLPRKLDLTNIKIKELGCEYVLRNVSNNPSTENMDYYNMEHQKVAVTFLNSNNVNDYVILCTHNTGKLLMYRSKIESWTFLDDYTLGYDDRSIFVNDWSLHYVDVVEFDGTFYAVTNSGRTVAIKVIGSSVTVTLLKNSIIGGDKKCLVKVGDDLLMVDLYTDITPKLIKVHGVEIFKLDKEKQKWDLVKDLEEHAIFLSNHSSFSAIGLKGCKGNCIYFHFKNLDNKNSCYSEIKVGDLDKLDDFEWKSDEIGVFDFEKGIFGPLEEYLEDSKLFSWPPPSWVTLARMT
ncbi:F-box protein SKIP23-like [Chenopodium quinoa]|uniref:KIB1-4 beta-propeller domain-containing protein n=1 Tax=Chenopodium quinoa TaxID=63459 RepID=A0A803LG83_CHEQI|nr:F-box protein SKIP23-like [Chenopodium quinoa]